MVKNSQGGNKSKGIARKSLIKRDTGLRVAKEEGEIYAQAVKVMGGCMVSAVDIDGNPLKAHIRGKFRGRGKRDNFISPGTWLLVGLHSWETDAMNCDILEVYSDVDKSKLRSSVTSVNWNKFISNDTKILGSKETEEVGDIEFADDATQEYEELIQLQASRTSQVRPIIENDEDEVNVEDI
jgi:hypothetical protein